MNTILLMTCVIMWTLAVITTVCLLKLLSEMEKLQDEQVIQANELEAVEVCLYREIKDKGERDDGQGKGEQI